MRTHIVPLFVLTAALLGMALPCRAGDLTDALENPHGAAADRIRKEAESYHDPKVQARARRASSWKDVFERCMGMSMTSFQAQLANGTADVYKGKTCGDQADATAGDPLR